MPRAIPNEISCVASSQSFFLRPCRGRSRLERCAHRYRRERGGNRIKNSPSSSLFGAAGSRSSTHRPVRLRHPCWGATLDHRSPGTPRPPSFGYPRAAWTHGSASRPSWPSTNPACCRPAFASSRRAALYQRVIHRAALLGRCIEHYAPTPIVEHETARLQRAVARLFGRPHRRPGLRPATSLWLLRRRRFPPVLGQGRAVRHLGRSRDRRGG